jgi:RalA-binding protein 1
VNELGRLCAELPLSNYTLLRFLSAHLIHVVQNEKVNKMSLRNVGIVFSPTLGMPAPLFALLLKEFDLCVLLPPCLFYLLINAAIFFF